MWTALNKPDNRALALNIGVFTGSAVLMTGLIFGLGWNRTTDYAPTPPWAPPDWVPGLVWCGVLFPAMSTARWLMNARSGTKTEAARTSVTWLLVSCVLWPLYSLAIGSVIGGLIGNVWVALLAILAVRRLWPLSKRAASCVFLVIPWITFASALILYELGWIR